VGPRPAISDVKQIGELGDLVLDLVLHPLPAATAHFHGRLEKALSTSPTPTFPWTRIIPPLSGS